MPKLTFTDVYQVSLDDLGDAATQWKTMADALGEIAREASEGMHRHSERARWAGVNAAVTKPFVGKTAREIRDAQTQAKSIWSILRDAHADLTEVQSDVRKAYDRDAGDVGCGVRDLGDGTVRCEFPGGPTANTGVHSQEATDAKQRLENRINRLVARAEEIDRSVARALNKSHGGDAHNFGHAEYTSLDDAQSERALELAALGPGITNGQLAEFNSLLKHNAGEPNGAFATRFYQGLGGPEEALRFYGRMAINGTEGDNPTRLAAVTELQRNMGYALANATEPDAPKGFQGTKHHLPASWGAEFRRLGTQPVELERGAMNKPYGYQILGGLLRHGNYDPRFLTPIAEHVTQLHREDPYRFLNNKPSPGDDNYGFNPSGKVGAGYVPLNSVLEALGHSPEAATKFFTETPTVYREDGTADRSATADFSDYVSVFTDEEFTWPADNLKLHQDSEDAFSDGPDALGHALEAATTGRPYDGDLSAPAMRHSPEQAELTRQLVNKFGTSPELLQRNENGDVDVASGPLYAMRDSLGDITAEYMPDFQRVIYGSGSDEDFVSFGASAALQNETVQPFLAVVGQDPDAYAAITAAQQAYTHELVDRAVNGETTSEAMLMGRVGNAVAPGAVMAGIMSEARAEAIHDYHTASDAAFNESAAEKQKWVDRLLGMGLGAVTSRVPIAGEVVGWVSEDIQESVMSSIAQDTTSEAQHEAGRSYARGRDAAIAAAQEAAANAAARGDVKPEIIPDLVESAAVQAGNSHGEGTAWASARTE
ncbi:DUF6571 family protein [Streptomyces albus]|uniref:DUF6571 family protein n=1 Tax=Streptomyces albus TaxID=1888 RepID=UPI0004C96705|nr:DUF6571 family protein [Streptomyces albus]